MSRGVLILFLNFCFKYMDISGVVHESVSMTPSYDSVSLLWPSPNEPDPSSGALKCSPRLKDDFVVFHHRP